MLNQSVFPRLDCARYRRDDRYRSGIHRLISVEEVGGFVLFEGDIHLVADVAAECRERSNNTLLLAADCEFGVPMRFPGGTEFPSMRALGQVDDLSVTYAVARAIAREVRLLGIDWNFAPVADVNINRENPIVNVRAFGGDPERVADHVAAYLQATQDEGVIACAKHFPGHGDTALDSHLELPVLPFDRTRLDRVEFPPFVAAINAGVKSIMVSHLAIPALDATGLPASLSRPITAGILRDEMGYEGVVVTDALDMWAIAKAWEPDDAAARAYLAGADVLAVPSDPFAALAGLHHAYSDGRITDERIERTAARIAALKAWRQGESPAGEGLTPEILKADRATALEAAQRSLRITKSRTITPSAGSTLLLLALCDDASVAKSEEWATYFRGWYQGDIDAVAVTSAMTRQEEEQVAEAVERAGAVVAGLFVRPRGFAGSVALSRRQQDLIGRASERPLVVMNFGNPYLLEELDPAVRIDAFSDSSASLAAAVAALSNFGFGPDSRSR